MQNGNAYRQRLRRVLRGQWRQIPRPANDDLDDELNHEPGQAAALPTSPECAVWAG